MVFYFSQVLEIIAGIKNIEADLLAETLYENISFDDRIIAFNNSFTLWQCFLSQYQKKFRLKLISFSIV